MSSNHLVLCHPLLLLPSIFPSIRVFSNESVLRIRWPKYWSFSFSISPSNEYSGLISFRMDWLDLLAVQGTLESLLQHHSSKASILCCSAFFMVQLSHPHITTGKTTALTRWTFVGKVMSLLFDMLSRVVIAFLPRSKRLLISWLQSPPAVILEPKKIKSATVSTVSSKWGWKGEEQTALLRVRTGPECPEGNRRELTWDSNLNCGMAREREKINRPEHTAGRSYIALYSRSLFILYVVLHSRSIFMFYIVLGDSSI